MSLDLPPVPAPFRLTLGTVMLAVITLGTVMLAVIAAAALLALGTRTEELLGPRGNRTERSDTVAVVLLGVVLSAVAVGLWRRFSARQVLAMISVCCGLMLIYIEAVIADLTRTTHYTESSRGPTHGGGVGPTSVGPVTPQGFWVSGPTEVGPTGLANARDPGDPV